MKRIFITGMSGTGKSSVIRELQSRGFTAIDTDYDDWHELSTRNGEPEWLWREERMHQLLAAPRTSPLFVSGCCANQGRFYSYFEYKVLFSAPLDVILERVAQRTTNPYGKTEAQQAEIRWNYENIQPLLRQSADIELESTQMSVDEMADFLVEFTLNGGE